jgi:hypothetical protein
VRTVVAHLRNDGESDQDRAAAEPDDRGENVDGLEDEVLAGE